MRFIPCVAVIVALAPSMLAADALALLPDASDTMVGFDLKSARTFAMYERLQRNWAPKIDDYIGLGGAASATVAKEIDSVTVGFRSSSAGDKSVLAVVEGNLKAASADAGFAERFGKAGGHGGVTLYERRQDGSQTPFIVAFLSDSLALTGAMDAVVEGIDRYQRTVVDRSERSTVLEQEARLAKTRGQTWMVTDDPVEGATSTGMDGGMASLFASLRTLSLSADMASGLDLAIVGRCASAGEASALAEMANGVLSMARSGVPAEQAAVRQALAAVRVGGAADRLELRARLSEAQWIGLMRAAGELRKEMLP